MKAEPQVLKLFSELPVKLKRVAACLAIGMSVIETADHEGIALTSAGHYRKELIDSLRDSFEEFEHMTHLKLAIYIVRRPEIEQILRDSL